MLQRKAASSSDGLAAHLLTLSPPLRAALLRVRARCLEVEALRLQRLAPGQPLTLEQLAAAHEAAAAGAAARLQQVRPATGARARP